MCTVVGCHWQYHIIHPYIVTLQQVHRWNAVCNNVYCVCFDLNLWNACLVPGCVDASPWSVTRADCAEHMFCVFGTWEAVFWIFWKYSPIRIAWGLYMTDYVYRHGRRACMVANSSNLQRLGLWERFMRHIIWFHLMPCALTILPVFFWERSIKSVRSWWHQSHAQWNHPHLDAVRCIAIFILRNLTSPASRNFTESAESAQKRYKALGSPSTKDRLRDRYVHQQTIWCELSVMI